MRIGEISRRTEIPIRMLRYYEERGLLQPQRTANGYRHYTDADVDRAGLVSSLIRSGLPTKLIIPMLAAGKPAAEPADRAGSQPGDEAADDLTASFTAELARLDSRIECLTMSRNAVAAHLQRRQNAAEPALMPPDGL